MKKLIQFAFCAVLAAGLAAPAMAVGAEMTRMEAQIRKEIVTLPYYSLFDNLSFKVDGSKVTLMGEVVRPTLKTSAERVVQNIEGVSQVDNQIKVLPVSPNDDRIRVDVYRAIYYNPMFNRYAIQAVPPIHIIVENGDVTLEGVVNSESEKNVAGVRANGVPGVFSVTNNLRVERD
ncbi:MAG: BON domain-containing protein [Bryobacterales bacterium]